MCGGKRGPERDEKLRKEEETRFDLAMDKELNRFYAELMASLAPAQKESVQIAQRQWLQYRDAEKAAFNAVDNDQNLSRASLAREAMRITKEQAERLARLLAR